MVAQNDDQGYRFIGDPCGAETQKISESYRDPSSRIIGGVDSLAGAVSRIVDDDNEDSEERRKRIEGQENGAAIGALIGLTAGLVTEILSSDSDKNNNAESDEGDTEGEYPAEDESFTIAHNM